MKLRKPVINHQWFEDSLRAGERLPESPYKIRSGEEVRLLKWKENLPPLKPLMGVGELYQTRTGEHVGPSEEGFYYTSRRRSDSWALRGADQVHEHDAQRRKSASSILLERCVDDQGRAAIDNVRGRGRGRSQFSAGSNREFNIVAKLSDDVVEGMRDFFGLQIPKLGSAPGVTEGTSADISRGKNPECCCQSSQPERDVACANCLVEAKSPSEGLLECGHKFCFMCIFTWTTQTAAKEPSCPLCKASCDFITKQEVDSAGKLDETLVDLCEKEMGSSSAGIQRTFVPDAVCNHCGNSDAEELLMRCETCGNRVIHTFCMDPPTQPPWCCPGCTQSIQRDSMRLGWSQFSTPRLDPYNQMCAGKTFSLTEYDDLLDQVLFIIQCFMLSWRKPWDLHEELTL